MRYLLILLIATTLSSCGYGSFNDEKDSGIFLGWGKFTSKDREIVSEPPIKLPTLKVD